jgi:excisionase family DNA binding protein
MKSNRITFPPEVPVKKTFCTTREAGILLGVSAGTVQLWVDSGLLQAWKTEGGHRRVLLESVNRLLQKKPDSTLPLLIPGAPGPSDPRRLRIVVVDDDENMLWLYQTNMSRWPIKPEITIFNDAVAALMSIGRSCPDLLVTDLHMPGMDGFNMLRVLSRAPEMSNTTIVVVSVLDPYEIQERGGIPPGIEVLPKPVPFGRLLTIATGMLNPVSSAD